MFRRIFLLSLLGFVGFLVYMLWPYDVLDLADHNPTTTSLMELREREAERTGHPLKSQMVWKNLNQISPAMIHAIVLSEDDTFYQHHGFDFEQIQIALQRNWAKKKYVYGGSTITQQLARTLFLRPKKTLLRKAKEAVLTVYLEKTLSKKRILEIYLNVVEFGPGIYGAEAASERYFSKPASELTSDEAVALASVLPSPRRWSPLSEKAFMARRRTQLLERMKAAGYLPPPAYFLDGDSTVIPFDPDALFQPAQPGTGSESDMNARPDTMPPPDTIVQPDGISEPVHPDAPEPEPNILPAPDTTTVQAQ